MNHILEKKYAFQALYIFFFLFINGLFILKYIGRTNFNPILVFLLYVIVCIGVILINNRLLIKSSEKTLKILYYLITATIILLISALLIRINPLTLQVDRWSAIHNFLTYLFSGQYPYSARTHLGGYGSPFPAWQFFHIPFFLIGNIALAMIFCIILLSIVLVWYSKSYKKPITYLSLIFISPAFWYEAAVRSDLLYNFILCFLTILYVNKKGIKISTKPILTGIICGVFLSTRLSVIIPLSIYLFSDFLKSTPKQKIYFSLYAISIFIVTFLPFIFWDFNSLFFFKYNPFVLQSRQGSVSVMILIAILGIYFSMRWKSDIYQYCNYVTITLVALVLLTFSYNMIIDHFVNGLFSSAYDITYFNMSIPFLIYSLVNKPSNSNYETSNF
ncbi:MAG: hypothetical protein WCK78_00355 [Paludibacter sp.]